MPPGSKCACIAKLAQLHTTVLDELHPCKEQVYESRISQLLGTIDALQLKNDDLRTELADLHSKIASDPFLSSRLQGVLSKLQNGSSRVYGSDFHAETNATALYRQLTILEDRNRELESRLSMEYAVSMSWKHKIQDIEHRLREQLDDLVGETRDVSCLKDSDAAKSRSDKREALSKEAFDLLKLARIRIADDKHRIDSFVARIADLEKELLEHRLRHPDLTNQTTRPLPGIDVSGLHLGRPHVEQAIVETARMQLSSSRNAIGCEREVELSRLSINNEPLIFNDNIGAAPAESNGSRESARRQKLISLYSDILDLLKQNRTKAPPVPIQQSKQTKTILVPVPADSKRKPRANKDSRRQHETSKSRSKSPDDVMSTDTLPMAPSAAPLSETKEAAATPLAHEKTSITAGGVEYNNKLPSNPSLGKEEGLAASEAENLDTVVAPSTFENQDEAFSDNLLSSAPQSDTEDSQALSDIGERNHELDISDDVMEEQPSIRNESLQSSDTIRLSEPEVPPSDSMPLSPDSISSVPEQNIAIRISSSINDVSPSRVSDSDFSDRSCQDVTSLHENESTVSSHSPPDAELDDNKLASDAMSWSDSISSETSLTPDDKEAFSPIVSHEDDAPVAQPVTSVATNVDESETDMIVNDDVEPPLSLGTNVVSVEHSIHSTSRSSTQDNVEEARHISKPPSAISDTESISGYSETPSLEYENSTVVLPGASIQPLTEQKRQILDALMLLLESVPILMDLPKERLRSLLPYFKLQSYPPRAAIILAGEKPRYFYILASGTVSAYSYEGVNKPNRLLRKYLNTDYFGELSLINKQACTSYIIAESHVTVQTMSGSNFLKLLKDLLPKFRERALASYSSNKNDDTNAEVTAVKKDFPDVTQFISGIPIVNVLAKQQNIAKLFRYRELSDGEILVKSILELRDLCVVYKGALDVKLHGSKKIAVIDPKSFIGGVDCFDSQVVDAMASSHLVARGDTLLLILDGDILRERFKNVLEHVRHFLEQYFRDKLQELELLQGVDSLSARFERITHSVNATISLTQQSSIAGSFINDSSEGELDSEDGSPVSVSTDTPYVSALTGSKMSFVETPNDRIETKSMEDDSDIMSSSKEASIQSNDRSDAPAAASISVASSIQQNDLDSDTMVTTETSDFDDSDSFTSNTISEIALSHNQNDGSRSITSFDSDSSGTLRDDSIITDSDACSGIVETDKESCAEAIDETIKTDKDMGSNSTSHNNQPIANVVRNTKRVPTGIFTRGIKASDTAQSILHSEVKPADSYFSDSTDSSDLSEPLSTFSDSALDDESCSSPRNYTDDELLAMKYLMIATLKTKFTSLGAAFQCMDIDNCGAVDRDSFFMFVENLCIASFENSDMPYLFDMLKDASSDAITMSSLYHSSGETITTTKGLHDRLQHAYGSARLAFVKQCGPLKMSTTCSDSDFVAMCTSIGVPEATARDLFKKLDVCDNGYVTVMTMLKLMCGDWTFEDAVAKESVASSSYNQILGYWTTDDYDSFRKELKDHESSVFDVLDYGVDVSLVDNTWEEPCSLADEGNTIKRYMDLVIKPAITAHPYYKSLSLVQKQYIATLLTESRQKSGSVVIAQGDKDFPLYLLLSGLLESSYTTYIFVESYKTEVEVGTWLDFDSLVNKQVATMTYTVSDTDEALLGRIDRRKFHETVVPMVETRIKRVAVIATFLSKVSCLEGLDDNDIHLIACASVVRKRKMHETIYRQGDKPDWFYIIFDGSVDLCMPGSRDNTAITLFTTSLLGTEEVINSMPAYSNTVIASSSTVLLLGWPAGSFKSVFGAACERIKDASLKAHSQCCHLFSQMLEASKNSGTKSSKSVSFSPDTADNNV